jgi:DMSO/TMAO reductase YedYZ molybdopterin-dependent catalytic subunit
MPRRLTNDLLVALVLGQVLGGVLGWALNVEGARPLYDLHRALGVAIVLLLGWKQAISLASLRRRLARRGGRDASVLVACVAGMALLVTLSLGMAWTLNLISFDWLWGYSPLNIHVILGICLVPFVGWHMLLRRRQNKASAPVSSRRALLRVGALSVATLVGWQAVQRLAPAVRLPTGSKPAGSFNGNAFTAEIWLFDSVPLLDAATWRLAVGTREFTLNQLVNMHRRTEVQAILDCTSGWWSEQVWSGFSLLDVLKEADLSSENVAITSVTGHRIVLPTADLQDALLATHVGGEQLSAGHGYPMRLVVPARRGYHWVKWVAGIESA